MGHAVTVHDFGFLGQGHYNHGTRWAYAQGCRCEPCRGAQAAYHRLLAKGLIPGLVDATRARERLHALQARGLGQHYIATLAGVSPETIRAILNGRARVSPRVERCILAVHQATPADGTLASPAESFQTREKLRRILSEGYRVTWVQQALGFAIGRLARGSRTGAIGRRVRVRAVRRVDAAYRLWVLGGISEQELDGPTC